MKYLTIIERTKTGFSAYSPDIKGCIATGRTKAETEKNMKEAIDFHLKGLELEKQIKPRPCSYSRYIEASV